MRGGFYLFPIIFVLGFFIDDSTDNRFSNKTRNIGSSKYGIAQTVFRCILMLFVIAHPLLQFSLKFSIVHLYAITRINHF